MTRAQRIIESQARLTRGLYWLDPQGQFHKVESGSHDSDAKRHLNEPHIPNKSGQDYRDRLWEKSWVRIVHAYYKPDEMLITRHDWHPQPLTTAQRRALQDQAFEGVNVLEGHGMRDKLLFKAVEAPALTEAQKPTKGAISMQGVGGWLDRSGNFFPLAPYNSHLRWSMWFQGKTVDGLQASGWLRVLPERGNLHVEGPTVSPGQSKTLGAFAADHPDVTVYQSSIGSRHMRALFGSKPDLTFHQ